METTEDTFSKLEDRAKKLHRMDRGDKELENVWRSEERG